MKNKFSHKYIIAFLISVFAINNSIAAPAVEAASTTATTNSNGLFYILLGTALFLLILIIALGSIYKSLLGGKTILEVKETGKPNGILMLAAIAMLPSVMQAQAAAEAVVPVDNTWLWILISLNLFLLYIVFLLLKGVRKLVRMTSAISQEEEAAKPGIIELWEKKLTDAVPVEREHEVMLDHDYDGIRELDNNLPPWWVYMFYASILFAIVYIGYYHFTDGKLQHDEYLAEMVEADLAKAEYMKNAANLVDETNVIAVTDMTRLEAGKAIFLQNCAPCHGQNGEGTVGPNLTDDYWLHGGGIANVFNTTKYGVPAKGMIAWQSQLGASQIQEVASYILTLYGTLPANPKEPQGEIWVAEKILIDSLSTTIADTVNAATAENK